MKRTPTAIRRAGEEGSYLVLAAFVLVVLMLAAALSVDVSRKYQLEQKAQDVADAAAIAGALSLPDRGFARLACTTYIQQAAGSWYVPNDSDVLISLASDNRTGAVGVMVRGSWGPIFMPTWLVGGETFGVRRYAIALMSLDTHVTTYVGTDTFGNVPGGPFAIFVGDTTISSTMSGNNIYIIGSTQFNDTVTISTFGGNIVSGAFNAVSASGGGGIVPIQPSPVLAMPVIDASKLVFDVELREDSATQTAYYATARPLLAKNGVAVPNTTARFTGETWIITSTATTTSALAGQTAAWGNGIDVNIVGRASIFLPNGNGGGDQNYWQGSFQSTKAITVTSNNSELRATGGTGALGVVGLDNPGLAFNSGTTLAPGTTSFSNGGNALDVYGLLATPGTLLWTGNMNAYHTGSEGTPGAYDASGNLASPPPSNGFVKGSVVAGALSSTGNQFKVYYDGPLSNAAPIINPVKKSPPQFGTPVAWLKQ